MCPDKEILSAHLDGELPPVWEKKLKQHLLECPACAKKFASLERLSGMVRGTQFEISQKEILSGKEKIYAELLERKNYLTQSGQNSPLWKRQVSLPFPLLAAAALVCLFLGAGLIGLIAGFSGGTLNPGRRQGIANSSQEERTIQLTEAELQELARLLQEREESVQVIIELPSAPIYGSGSGNIRETEFIRAADYQGSGGHRR